MSDSIIELHPLLREFSQITIYFPEFAIAFSKLCNAIELCNLNKSPMSAIICGHSGVGKTTLLYEAFIKYAQKSPEEKADGIYIRDKAVYFEVPEPITIRELVDNMLIRLGVTNARGSVAHLTSMLITQLQTKGTQVIFLDEIQRLCFSNADKVRVPILNWLTNFMNKLEIPVILAGTQECRYITNYDQPFASRYPWMIVLNPLEYERRPDSHYHRILEKFDETMHELWPMASEVHLNDVEIGAQLFIATSGNLKQISMILILAFYRCLGRAKSCGLTREDLKYACDQLILDHNLTSHNPFLLDLRTCTKIIAGTEETRQKIRVPV
ncbi:TniB family NTP-binding protein [Pseudomonas sp. NPDC087612]|uniref:TniB family NTP-binding protein n=1 Tax=Pseudomonas sp. NPDC087612 TaxID=3364441 RepID=UPI0038166E8B